MLVVGLGHKMRMGKNTFADYLKELYGNKYYIKLYSFGQALKEEVNQCYESQGSWSKVFEYIHHQVQELPPWVSIEHSADMSDPNCPYGKQRYLLQWWGTEYRRNQSPNYWVKKLAAKIKDDDDSIQIGIITDLRFSNEFYWVKSLGRDGITVKVTNPNVKFLSEHASENALEDFEFDYEITASSLETLRDDAIQFGQMLIDRDSMPDSFRRWDEKELTKEINEGNK